MRPTRTCQLTLCAGLVAAFGLATLAGAQPIFVNAAAPGSNTGASWTDALTDLQSALAIGAGREIWIAQGTYFPGPSGSSVTTSFIVPSGATIIGGFIGFETSAAQRTPGEHATILSGDLARNDPAGSTDNASHVLTIASVAVAPTLDGLTITAGRAAPIFGPPIGGGLVVTNAGVIVRDCVFVANTTVIGGGGGGGAVGLMNSPSAHFTRTRFESNTSAEVGNNYQVVHAGGAFYAINSTLVLSECEFLSNHAGKGSSAWCDHGTVRPAWLGSPGGAVALDNCSSRIEASRFVANSSGNGGDGIVCWVGSSPHPGPGSAGGSGAAIYASGGALDVVSCVFAGNLTGRAGSSPDFTGYAGAGSETIARAGVISRIAACTFVANLRTAFRYPEVAHLDGAFYGDLSSIVWSPDDPNTPVDPHFVSPTGFDGVIGTPDDDLRLMLDSPYIDAGNNSLIPAGFTIDAAGSPRFIDIPSVPDTGAGTPPIVDRGAFEARPPACAADFDASGTLTVLDLFAFLNAWFGHSPSADFNGNGLSPQDIFDFLNAWFASCP